MGLLKWMPDSMYLKNKYRTLLGRKLDLDNPKSFNEKLQWLKIHDRKSAYTTMVDKYAVKRFNSPIVRPLSDLTQRDNHILFFIWLRLDEPDGCRMSSCEKSSTYIQTD